MNVIVPAIAPGVFPTAAAAEPAEAGSSPVASTSAAMQGSVVGAGSSEQLREGEPTPLMERVLKVLAGRL